LRAFGHVHGARGDFNDAIHLVERSLALSHDRNIPQLSPEVADVLGYMHTLSGRVAKSIPMLEEALASMESMGHFQWRPPLIVHLSEAYLLSGRAEEALVLGRRGLTLASERGHRGSEAWALRLLGEIAAHQNGPDVAAAEAHYGANRLKAVVIDLRQPLRCGHRKVHLRSVQRAGPQVSKLFTPGRLARVRA
jgi:tetratricopeptide (TPR) repeat protein